MEGMPTQPLTSATAFCHTPTTPVQAGQRAAKYAACLALFAVDPEQRNRAYALRTLREFVAQRR